MYKNRLQMYASPTALALSPAHSYTLIPADEDDDSDICPVCDGECTCTKAPRAAPGAPLSMAELSLRYAAAGPSTSTTPSAPTSPSSGHAYPPSTPSSTTIQKPVQKPTPKPSLKIKLTVPSNMLAKRKVPPPPSTTATTPSSAATSSTHIKSYTNRPETTFAFGAGAYTSSSTAPSPYPYSHRPPTKKRGRPPKSTAPQPIQRPGKSYSPNAHAYKPLNPKSAAPGKHPKTSASITKVRQNLKARAAVAKKVAKKRRAVVSSDEESSSSELSDVDMAPVARRAPYDAESGSFPTFISASGLSSMSSDNSDSSSSLSEFDSDSSIEAEEENFILADVQDKARIKRELLGGDDASLQKRRTAHNSDWVIRPRKKSVGPSDVEMDVDSDATEDDDDDEAEGEDDDEEDADEDAIPNTTITNALGLGSEDYDETGESTDDRRRYTGHATGWSDEDDDESSFDADIFFANLSDDSDSITSDSDAPPALVRRSGKKAHHAATASMGEDGDQSDISGISESTEGASGKTHARRATLESLPFEITEGWDGQLVFTNGIAESENIVDLEFEEDAREFGVDSSATRPTTPTEAPWRGVRRMGLESNDGADEMDMDMDDEGYQEESDGEGTGDTTDEELVGPDELPNERAMRLFSLPMSVSAINPLSTVSSPAVSPGQTRAPGRGKGYLPGWGYGAGLGHGRRREAREGGSVERERERERRRRMWGGDGVRAQDILEGRVLFWDSDEQEHDCDVLEKRVGWGGRRRDESETEESEELEGGGGEMRRWERRMSRGPMKGVFVPSGETRQAVIGDEKKGADVPSPHPRFNRGRARKSAGKFSAVEHLLRRHLQSIVTSNSSSLSNSLNLGPVSAAPTNAQSPTDNTADMCASLDLLFSSAAALSATDDNNMGMDVDGNENLPAEAEPIQLDDVLDAAFLEDEDESSNAGAGSAGAEAQGGAGDVERSAAGACGSAASNAGAGATASTKDLSRWDLISVGAFRQTHTPASSADFGNVMKPAPMSAMLWQQQQQNQSHHQNQHHHHHHNQHHQNHNNNAVPSGSGIGRGVKGIKHAKRRQMMMGASGMSSPLVLPSSGSGSSMTSTAVSVMNSPATTAKDKQLQMSNTKEDQQKIRRELRRERKMMKKTMKVHGGAGSSAGSAGLQHHHGGVGNGHGHQFHAHQHHPNAKMRGAGATQRSNFFSGAVPPLNL